jgi:motility quorum-sensing regulator/GCU-specific mRNA interferase toxin
MLPYEPGRSIARYDLEALQQLVGQGELSCMITTAARVGARECGLDVDEVVEAVLDLSTTDFYKSMEAEKRPALWQDVYHSSFRGVNLYIKLQLGSAGDAVVVQFKRR